MYGEKAWRQLHKNAVSNVEQVPEFEFCLMPEKLNWFCFLGIFLRFRVWVLVIFYYICLDFDEEVGFF